MSWVLKPCWWPLEATMCIITCNTEVLDGENDMKKCKAGPGYGARGKAMKSLKF